MASRVTWIATLFLICASSLRGEEAANVGADQFEREVRPVLVGKCLGCHSAAKSESGLRLDQRDLLLKGGDSGPAVVPGDAKASLMIQAVHRLGGVAMPPDEPLDPQQVAALERWVAAGAPWPDNVKLGGVGPAVRSGPPSAEERQHWAYQPITDPPLPDIQPALTSLHPIDRFVIDGLNRQQLTMRPPADRRTLLRRATLDLTGLPPTPEEIDAFLSDSSPDAFAKVVDRLLESPAYGQQWGRHWLDVVRYADTAGETADYPTPLSYKYRNWVIQALNDDMPYDQFLRWQVAGDILARDLVNSPGQLAPTEVDHQYAEMVTATGFIAISRRFGFDIENYHQLTIQDTIDTVGQSVLGLTLGCARCHDHKFDPVSMADYYAWYGIFSSTRYSFPGSEEKKRPYDLFPQLPPQVTAQRQSQYDQQLAEYEANVQRIEGELKQHAAGAADDRVAADLKQQLTEVSARRDQLRQRGPFAADELIYGAMERDQPEDVPIQLRGEKSRPGEVVKRRNLDLLGGELVAENAGSGRRQLAEWLTAPQNPLTARVIVNRVWQHHFGRGLVGTENDFGVRGERPTHPELLDWLASRFVEHGWSIKEMHRLVMSSAAYQQSSDYDVRGAELDPDARWLWRFNRRRLSAEEIRDAMLMVSGDLDLSVGGSHPFPASDTWGFTQHSPFYAEYPTRQRSVYLMQQRLKRHPFLALFDGADPNVSTARRSPTTVPTQTLFLMNDQFVHAQSESLARRCNLNAGATDEQLTDLWRRTLGRPASPDELHEAKSFLADYAAAVRQVSAGAGEPAQPAATDADLAAGAALARTLMIRNEFLFVD
ncbi:MAG: DUF1553 domain-containing protein [Pirellulales bacterium]